MYDECLTYLQDERVDISKDINQTNDPDYESIDDCLKETKNNSKYIEKKLNNDTRIVPYGRESHDIEMNNLNSVAYKVENELKSTESLYSECRSERLRKFSQQLPKIIITQSNPNLERQYDFIRKKPKVNSNSNFNLIRSRDLNNIVVSKHENKKTKCSRIRPHLVQNPRPFRRGGYAEFHKRLVAKTGLENVALISNVPFEKIRLLNDTFHTLINLRWRWIVSGTIVVHFAIWLVFAVFWYFTALAHYDFEPDPPKKTCITGGTDFVTIFLASVEAQTTIGFGDRAIDEECPETIFLFIMQLILGTGLSGVLTCVVYAKLTRPEKLSRDGVGFSKKAVISMRDGKLCLMMRAWDLNYDHIINSEFTAHFIHTHRTKEGEVLRYYALMLPLQQRQFLLWPVTLVHEIDENSPLYAYSPEHIACNSYEITVSLKGASASMGTFTQSQTSYLPREVLWGQRFPPVVKYDCRKQKYVIDHKKLDATEPADTPYMSAKKLNSSSPEKQAYTPPPSPSSFSEQINSFKLERSSSFRNNVKS